MKKEKMLAQVANIFFFLAKKLAKQSVFVSG
jgi:hypothetical protein